MLEKTYDAAAAETRIYESWEAVGAFKPEANPAGEPFCLLMPPPNVTGSLHMGHALNCTLQDILARWRRMQGRAVLWQPGTDHAGIATQMVVERQLAEAGVDRRDMGRGDFVGKVWEWKEKSGGRICKQLRRLGASCDWSRERFTMDAGFSAAVTEAFVRLHEAELVYRDRRLVNWDPQLGTAVSDLEIEQREADGCLWHFRYPVEDAGRIGHVVVATTRPETMLGDMAVAVNPHDERYKDLVGKNALLPLVGRKIPIIADDYADPAVGSGAVKITPAHDFNDFEVGRRHGLVPLSVIDRAGRISRPGEAELHGKDRFEARAIIIGMLDAQGLLEKTEPHRHAVPHGDRSGVPLEPLLTDQWFIDAAKLAGAAMDLVRRGEVVFASKRQEKLYFQWLENIKPWCVSRQLWWGHRIPAWRAMGDAADPNRYFVARSEEEAWKQAAAHYGSAMQDMQLRQDQDVLDTWFSSGLWSFATMGWPESTADLQRYHPADVLVTGADILFFWTARMLMLSKQLANQAPFRQVYLHGLVTDAAGAKMTKSKGNVVDPLDVIEKYGADALRMALAAAVSAEGGMKFAEKSAAGYRNFATKLWNAARFVEMNGCERHPQFDPAACRHPVNQWIVVETAQCARQVDAALENFRFADAAAAAYRFAWHVFCDWYLELAKPVLDGAETPACAAWALDELLKLLHPFMPFVTEEIWGRTGGSGLLMTADWPDEQPPQYGVAAIENLIALITEIRSVRAALNVPAGQQVPLAMEPAARREIAGLEPMLLKLARLSEITEAGAGLVQITDGVSLVLADIVDFAVEKARQEQRLATAEQELAGIEQRLGNPGFRANAPAEVVAETEAKAAELAAEAGRIRGFVEQMAAE